MKWTEVQEQGVRKLAEQCRGLHWLHERTNALLRRDELTGKVLLTVMVLLSFALTVLDDIKQDVILSIFRQLTLFASQLAVLYRLYVGDSRTEVTFQHLAISKEYLNLSLTAENELRKPRADRDKVSSFTKRVESEYRRLLNNNLTIHQRAIDEFKETNRNSGASLPLVVGGVDPVLVNVHVEERESIMPKTYGRPE